MTTSNFKTVALAITALFTFAFTSCEKNEIADLAPANTHEVKATGFSLDPHELIEDESTINKPYNGLSKPYHEFTNSLSNDAHADVPKPPGPVFTDGETKRVRGDNPTFSDDNTPSKPGHVLTDNSYKRIASNTPVFTDGNTPTKPSKPVNTITDAQLKVRQIDLIDGKIYEDYVLDLERYGWDDK